MVKKKVGRKAVLWALTLALMIGCSVFLVPARAHAAESEEKKAESVALAALPSGDDVVEPQGLFTRLTLTVGGDTIDGKGYVWAVVRNDFTLGYSTISVYVELYSSPTYKTSYKDMTIEARNYVYDLNIHQTVKTSITTCGEQKYWIGRMRFKFDDKAWESEVTDIALIAADGSLIDKFKPD